MAGEGRESRGRAKKKINPLKSAPVQAPTVINQYFVTVHLSVFFFCRACTSFRAVSKILSGLIENGLTDVSWAPHFTSVINWVTRIGLYLLSSVTAEPATPFLWIIDHTIQVGSRKAMVVLRAPLDVMKKQSGLTLNDVEVVLVSLKSSWIGETVAAELKDLAKKIGAPAQIISDYGPDVKKGISDYVAATTTHWTYDLTHLLANCFKAKYDGIPMFQEFITQIANAKNQLKQTALSYLMPPKLRSKARFMNIAVMTKWVEFIMAWNDRGLCPESIDWSEKFKWFRDNLHFIRHLGSELAATNELQKIIKTEGLNKKTYDRAVEIVSELSSHFREPLTAWLAKELTFANSQLISSALSSFCRCLRHLQ